MRRGRAAGGGGGIGARDRRLAALDQSGRVSLEPSELAKLALVLVLVRYLREEPPRGGLRLRHMIVPAVLLACRRGWC